MPSNLNQSVQHLRTKLSGCPVFRSEIGALYRSLVVVNLCFVTFDALGHSSGHGPILQQRGPGGGQIAAVVSSVDAEKGERARPIGFVEWKLEDKRVQVSALSMDLKPLDFASWPSRKVKWIALVKKPKVIATESLSLPLIALEGAESVEIIFDSGVFAKEKSVVVLNLGNRNDSNKLIK